MSRTLKIVLVTVILIVTGFYVAYQKLSSDLERLKERKFEIASTEWKNGTTLGEAKQFPIKVKLEVKINDKRIEAVTILEHQTGEGQSAEKIVEDVIRTQGLSVDVITGATYSSILILEAIEDALRKASE